MPLELHLKHVYSQELRTWILVLVFMLVHMIPIRNGINFLIKLLRIIMDMDLMIGIPLIWMLHTFKEANFQNKMLLWLFLLESGLEEIAKGTLWDQEFQNSKDYKL